MSSHVPEPALYVKPEKIQIGPKVRRKKLTRGARSARGAEERIKEQKTQEQTLNNR